MERFSGGVLRGPKEVPDDILASFGDDEDKAIRAAIKWAWMHKRSTGMTQRRLAELIGISNSHLCNIIQGDKYLPPQKINAYEWATGHKAVTGCIARFARLRELAIVEETARMIAEHMVSA